MNYKIYELLWWVSGGEEPNHPGNKAVTEFSSNNLENLVSFLREQGGTKWGCGIRVITSNSLRVICFCLANHTDCTQFNNGSFINEYLVVEY